MEQNEIASGKTLFQKLILFFTKPSELFRDYIERPSCALKLMLIALTMAGYTYAIRILGKDIWEEMMEDQLAALTPEQAEAARASMAFMNSPVMNIAYAAIAAVSTIAIILLISFVYKVFIKALKGDIKYSQAVSIYSLAYMASVIGLVFKLAFMYFTGNLLYIDVSPTYADALYNNLDPFVIWQAILMVSGVTVVSGIPEKKSILLVVCMWLASLAISLGAVFIAH